MTSQDRSTVGQISNNKGTMGQLNEFDHVQSGWTIFLARLEQHFIVNVVYEGNIKRDVLLNSLIQETYKLVWNLCYLTCVEWETV